MRSRQWGRYELDAPHPPAQPATRTDEGAAMHACAEATVTRRAADIRVDWRRIIAELRAHHGSHTAVAVCVGMQRTSLVMLVANRAEPRYSDGRALVAAWAQATGGDEASPPMIRVRDICEP